MYPFRQSIKPKKFKAGFRNNFVMLRVSTSFWDNLIKRVFVKALRCIDVLIKNRMLVDVISLRMSNMHLIIAKE